jgi:TonB family protein
MYAYALVCLLLMGRITGQAGKLMYFSRTSRSSQADAYRLVLTEGKLPTFSFFRLLFWDNTQPLTDEQKRQILYHELTHIRQWHSLDILFLELVKAFFWFHPAVYLFKKELQQTHEYLADAAVVKEHSRDNYIQLMVSQVFNTSPITLTNPFSQLKTKNRILMLHKINRTKPAFWKIALSLPLITLLALFYACDTTHPEDLITSGTKPTDVKEVVEDMPDPVNGLLQDISTQITYPEKARNENIEGLVFVEFVVKKDGNVDQVKVINGIGYGCDEEAVRAVRATKWNPGKEQGKPVEVRMVMPIAFALSDAKRVDLLNRSIPKMQSLEQHESDMYELQTPSPSGDQRLLPPPLPPRIIYQVVEVQPKPKGGISALMQYLDENIRYPEVARRKGTEGKVFVQFVIDTDGGVSEVQVLKGIGNGCDEEAIRVIEAMPAWKPGVHKGEPVNVRMSLPINFQLD